MTQPRHAEQEHGGEEYEQQLREGQTSHCGSAARVA
jgi:hypothetical protein